jgi:phosphoenolpyruvate phosphomutase
MIGLEQILSSKNLSLIMEAHSGISAKIVEECGFPAIWASGLSIASLLGVRDTNEASWTQILDIVEYMTDSVDIPILFDGDTGFGNFNNVRRLVKKLEQRRVAGIVIEDKLFPKMNSFIGKRHELAATEEFCGKIKAAVDHRSSSSFQIVARTEALIAGHGIEEALYRCNKYVDSGAEAIFIHSRSSNAGEVIEFAKFWDKRVPLVIAPTTYYKTSLPSMEELGVTACICANQNLRASVKAMYVTSMQIINEHSLSNVEKDISSLEDIFTLLDYDELKQAEKKYLPNAR